MIELLNYICESNSITKIVAYRTLNMLSFELRDSVSTFIESKRLSYYMISKIKNQTI